MPDDLDTFTSAKVVLIPEAPGGATTLGVFVCAAQDTDPVGPGLCNPQVDHAFIGVVNQLHEIDITAAVAPLVGAAGLTNLAVLAYTAPTTLTDRIVGMRFTYDPVAPVIPPASITTAELAFDPATQVELDSHAGDLAAHHPRYTDAEAIAAAQIGGGFATLGANTFTGTQSAPAFEGDGSGLTNIPMMIGGSGSVTNLTAVTFATMFGDGTGLIGEDDKLAVIAQGGTLGSFRIHLRNAPGTGVNIQFTVRKNKTDTAVTCNAADTATSCSDLVNTASFAAGDLITIKAEQSGTSFGQFSWAALYTP